MFTTQLPTASSFRQSRQRPVDPNQDPNQSPQPTTQAAPTFAQLQQQGRARPPAPSGAFGAAVPAGGPPGIHPINGTPFVQPTGHDRPFPLPPAPSASPASGYSASPASGYSATAMRTDTTPQPATNPGLGDANPGLRLPPGQPTDTTPGSTTGPTPPSTTTGGTSGGGIQIPGQGSTAKLPLQDQITQAILGMFGNPGSYNSAAVENEYKQLAQQIDDQYTLGRQEVNDNLAARGLGPVGDSSIGLGRLSDLNVARKTAQEQAASDLITKQAQSRDQALSQAIQAALGLGGLSVNQQNGGIAQLLQYLALLQNGGALPTGGTQ